MNPFHYFEFRYNYLVCFINVTHLVYTTVQKFGISKIFNVCFCNKYYRFGVRGGGGGGGGCHAVRTRRFETGKLFEFCTL